MPSCIGSNAGNVVFNAIKSIGPAAGFLILFLDLHMPLDEDM